LQLTWLSPLADFGIWLWLLVSQSVSHLLGTAAPSTFSDISIYKAQNLHALPEASHFTLDKNRANLVYFIFASSRGLAYFFTESTAMT